MKIKLYISLVVFIVVLSGCFEHTSPTPIINPIYENGAACVDGAVDYEVLSFKYAYNPPLSLGGPAPEPFIIDNQVDFIDLVNDLSGSIVCVTAPCGPEVPDIDFNNKIVIVYGRGMMSYGNGVGIKSIETDCKKTYVNYVYYAVCPGEVVPTVMVTPSIIVVVDKFDWPIEFNYLYNDRDEDGYPFNIDPNDCDAEITP